MTNYEAAIRVARVMRILGPSPKLVSIWAKFMRLHLKG